MCEISLKSLCQCILGESETFSIDFVALSRHDCVLTSMLRRTLLELTLNGWNASKRTGDVELEKLCHDEAITVSLYLLACYALTVDIDGSNLQFALKSRSQLLSENQGDNMEDYEALVIIQAAGFAEGELEQYARSGSERARRHMLAMCEHDPELFAEVLAHFVAMAWENLNKVRKELLNL